MIQGRVTTLSESVIGRGYANIVLDRLARHVCDVVDADGTSILLRDRNRPDTAIAVAGCGLYEEIVGNRVDAWKGVTGEILAVGKTAVVPTRAKGVSGGSRKPARVRAAVPLRCGDRILGALEATSVDSRRFGRKDLDLLSELAELSSPALAHAERRAQSSATVGKRVRALLARIDAHDGYTAGHAEAVGALSCRLGERLRLSLVDLFELELAALFHDVGKLAVPETILSKSDSLDYQELAVVRCHAIWGAELLASIPGLAPVATLVRFHHERWDGGGYPDGIDGERIPLASRILAVCDAYHAMTSDRSYRAALPRERAVAELRGAAGHQFDPAVVDSFLALVGDAGRSSDPARRRRVARAFELAHPPVAAR